MRVRVISIKLHTCHIFQKGIADRRFKTGYRVLPKDEMGYQMDLHLYNPDMYFRIGQTVWALNTKFIVVATDNAQSPSMVLRQCKAVEEGNDFNFTAEIDVLPLHFTIGEGSYI